MKKHWKKVTALALAFCMCVSLMPSNPLVAAETETSAVALAEEVTTQATTEATTEATTQATTEATTQATTEATQASTETTEATTEKAEEATTEAHKHNYSATFDWTADFSACTATLTCADCNDKQTVQCAVTSEKVDNKTVYTATATKDGATFTDKKEVDENNGVSSGKMWYAINDAGRVDIRGFRDGNKVQTTYADAGYYTALSCDDYSTNDMHFSGNGRAWQQDGVPLSVTPKLSFVANDTYVVATYTVKNISDKTVRYNFGVHADVDIDDDDYATVEKTNTGIKMINTHENNNTVYYMACRNISGFTNSDTLWIGYYSDRMSNLYTDGGGSTLTGTDSGFATSWKSRVLNPGETASYSFEVGIGAGSAIVAPTDHKHTYDDPTFVWTDEQTCVAQYTCKECGYTDKKVCEVTTNEEGESVVSVEIDGETYTAPHTHTFGEPTFEWDHNYTKCIATSVCSECGAKKEEVCEISTAAENDDDGFLVATVEINGKTYTNTPEAVVEVKKDSADKTDKNSGLHIIGSGEGITLECNVPLKYFVSVEVDGKLVDRSNYTLKEGSTVLTFTSKYLDTLKVGKHKVTMNYNINGKELEVDTNIVIRKKNTSSNKTNNNTSNKTNNKTNNRTTQFNAKGYMTMQIVDKNGNAMKGYTLSVDSKSATTLNADGRASFSNILAGNHTLYLKNSNKKTIASKNIKVAYANRYYIEGNTVNVIEDKAFVLHAKYDGKEIILLSVEAGSPQTGDTSNTAFWASMMLASALGLLFISRKRKFA